MPRRTKRDQLEDARPHVQELLDSLTDKRPQQAEALGVVLALAEDAVRDTEAQAALDANLDKTFAIPVESGLFLRSYESPNIKAEITEGWEAFLNGKWEPTQPVRAARGTGVSKSPVNVRMPKELVDRVEAAADQMVADKGWSTTRGSKLTARHVAAQWLALKYPAPETDTAAE
ncbi:hypothetical protein ACFQ0X_44115 [Streptomyces rectiviolaceus]|uniref:Uncharacterized protein n=1 Tax=Streptomyces rectiviolaceus TaxID=332591 RepID=A0ABP6NQG1_9ACTN